MCDERPGYRRTVAPGDAVTLWELSPIVEASFPGMPMPAEDRVRYRFRNGFVDVGDLPCRTAFRTEMIGRPITPWTAWPTDAVYAPAANRRVEFTAFRYGPTHRRRWCRTVLTAAEDGAVPFRLATCGGVRIWVGGEEVVRFEPFRRNAESRTDVVLPLKAGDNDVLLHMEDLFERDTTWFFELVLAGEMELEAGIRVDADPALVARLTELSAGVRVSREVVGAADPFALTFPAAPDRDVSVAVRVHSTGHDRRTFLDTEATLKAGETTMVVAPAGAVREGHHHLTLTMRVGVVTVVQSIGAPFLYASAEDLGADLPARKRLAMGRLAADGDPLMGRALAMMEAGAVDPVAFQDILAETLRQVETREDCSDFHMVSLLVFWARHREALDPALRARVKAAILGWRYWVDEPGNDVMWFWSENHTLCFHVSQYLAGRLFPAERFACSGRFGRAQEALGAVRLAHWMAAAEEHGFIEWNSAAYYPIDFIGLFGLQILADGALQRRAEGLLDGLFRMIALHTLAGVPAGSQGRAYDKELRAGPLTELASFAAVGLGGPGYLTTAVLAMPLFCLSDYAPPSEALALGPVSSGEAVKARYTQGIDHNAKLHLFRTDASMLSAVLDHHGGRPGHQQHVIDVRLAGDPMARLWVNNPGEEDPWGEQRPSFWSGNGVLPQVAAKDGTALMVFDLGETARVPWTHVFAPAERFDALDLDGDWLFARSGDGFAAIWASGGLTAIEAGATAEAEWRSTGRRAAYLLTIGCLSRDGTFDRFKATCRAAGCRFDPAALILSATIDGKALALDGAGRFSVDGEQRPFTSLGPVPVVTRMKAAAAAG